MNTPFSIRESLRFAWETFRAHNVVVFQATLTLLGVEILSSITDKALAHSALGSFLNLALSVLSFFLEVGVFIIMLKLARGFPTSYREILAPWRFVWRSFVAGILLDLLLAAVALLGAVLVFGSAYLVHAATLHSFDAARVPLLLWGVWGMVVLVVGASLLYLAVRYSMIWYAVLDGAGVRESFSTSARLTKDSIWRLFLFMLVSILLNLLGLLVFMVGLLVTLPLTMLAFAHIYTRLKEPAETAEPVESEA